MLRQYENNGFKTLVSNDYDYIIEQLIEYFRDVRINCSYCPRKFISPLSIKNHIKSFHKELGIGRIASKRPIENHERVQIH